MVILRLFFLIFCCLIFSAQAGTIDSSRHPLYLSLGPGYGSTTWYGLVPLEENQNMAIGMSTPINVNEGGITWGVFVGYEFISAFAIEASYTRYPEATVFFDATSLFSFNNDDLTEFNTKTEAFHLMAKIMLPISTTGLRIYSSIGAARVHRADLLLDAWHYSPSFGAGVNFNVSEHIVAELAGNYTAGYGESQLEPSINFFPFLYSVLFRVGYRF